MSKSQAATVVTSTNLPYTASNNARGRPGPYQQPNERAYRRVEYHQPPMPGQPPYPLPANFPLNAVAQPDVSYHLPPIPVQHEDTEELMDQRNTLLWREIIKQGEIYSPRFDHSTIRRGGEVFLFGGCTANFYTINEYLNDLFVFDTMSGLWSRLFPQSTSPCPRAGQSLVMHKNKRLHLFGGRGDAGTLGDLWTYDMKRNLWASKRPGGLSPPPRSHHTAVVWLDSMYVYGGTDADEEGEVWCMDMTTRTWSRPVIAEGPKPPKRIAHEAVAVDGEMFIFAGMHLSGPAAGETSNDFWVLDLTSPVLKWRVVDAEGPPPICRHGAASVKIGNRWVIQGGRTRVEDDVVSQTDDALAFHFTTKSWQPLPESLVPFCQASRWGHKLNLIRTKSGSHCILLTGGVTLCRLPLH